MTQFVGLRAVHTSGRVRVPSLIPLAAPTSPHVTAVASGGTFTAATYFWKIVAVAASGVSLPSAEVTTAIAADGSATLTWAAATGAASYQIWRGTATGAEDHYQTSSTNSFTDTGAAGTAGTLPTASTGVRNGGLAELHTTQDTVVDLDNAPTRVALVRHSAIGEYYVSACNNTAHSGTDGALTDLPADA